jgi:hypothetical protein
MNVPMDFVLRQMGQNNAKLSYVERLMRGNVDAEGEADIEQSTAALYAGGADSTAAALSFFFLAMTTFPEVQKRACEEIDLVVGHKRLPDFLDRERVPYIEGNTLLAPLCSDMPSTYVRCRRRVSWLSDTQGSHDTTFHQMVLYGFSSVY